MSAGKYQLEFGATDAGYTSTINKVKMVYLKLFHYQEEQLISKNYS